MPLQVKVRRLRSLGRYMLYFRTYWFELIGGYKSVGYYTLQTISNVFIISNIGNL
jgi:hypothetical protein